MDGPLGCKVTWCRLKSGIAPVNFYAGFYQQPRKDERPCTWQVVQVVAFDKRGRKVAERKMGEHDPNLGSSRLAARDRRRQRVVHLTSTP